MIWQKLKTLGKSRINQYSGDAALKDMDLDANVSAVNCLLHGRNESSQAAAQSSSVGVSTALASVLIFTIVVDILGNVLVILSVFRNKKLRNAGEVKGWSS